MLIVALSLRPLLMGVPMAEARAAMDNMITAAATNWRVNFGPCPLDLLERVQVILATYYSVLRFGPARVSPGGRGCVSALHAVVRYCGLKY